MTDKLRELLEDIQQWMMDNDYECGIQGSEIYDRIRDELKNESGINNV